MPLYDYDCAACGRRFEVVHGVHADGPTACPLCGGGPVRKAITAAAVHFKGSGWAKKERRATVASGAAASTDGASGSGSEADGDGGAAKTTDGASSATKEAPAAAGAASDKGTASGSGGAASSATDKGSGKRSRASSGATTHGD